MQRRIQDFKLGGVHLKKLCRVEGGVKNFGVFRVKNHDFMPKNYIFSNFRGGHAGCTPPPGSIPEMAGQIENVVLFYVLVMGNNGDQYKIVIKYWHK
jgi:hypothetical protein